MIINEKKDGTKYARSSLEKQFERMWVKAYPHLDLSVELTLIPGRRFRCDYSHLPSKVVIEIHGGAHMKVGGHSTAKGKMDDAEKSNLLVSLGYRPFTLWGAQITLDNIHLIGGFINGAK